MRKTFYAVVVILGSVGLLTSSSAAAQAGQGGDFGIGAILGSPTGLSMKYWMTDMTAIDGALAWHFGDDDRFQIHADHLWHIHFASLNVPDARLPFHVGVGLRVLAGNHSEAGLRIPFGVDYLPTRIPLEFFAEIAPVVDFAPETEADVEGGVGVRFYFK